MHFFTVKHVFHESYRRAKAAQGALAGSPVEYHLRWGCRATFNRAGMPENDPASLKLRRIGNSRSLEDPPSL